MVCKSNAGSQSAGQIGVATNGAWLEVVVRLAPKREIVKVPVRYELLLNDCLSREAQYATLVHELAHLYCGHFCKTSYKKSHSYPPILSPRTFFVPGGNKSFNKNVSRTRSCLVKYSVRFGGTDPSRDLLIVDRLRLPATLRQADRKVKET